MKRADVNKLPMKDTVLTALESEAKEYRLNNGDNLYFVVNPKGNKRWELRYKKPSTGKWSFLGLGTYPEVGSKWAKQKAEEARKLIAQGVDPVIKKQEEKQAVLEQSSFTFHQLAEDLYKTKTWTPDTKARNIGAINNHVIPVMGSRDYRKITKQEWHALFQDIQKKQNPRTGKPIIEMGQRVTALVQEMYDYAEVTGKAPYNPITNLHKYLKKHVSNSMKHVDESELPVLLRAIDSYPATDTSQHWNELYAQTQDLYGTAANLFIQQISDKIRIEGKTLAVAEGEGRNILYLAERARQQGYPFSADVWDYSDVALKHLSSKAEAQGIKVELKHVDLTVAQWPSEFYQNVICVFGHFDTETQKQVLEGIRKSLLNGGWFIGELYSKEQIDYKTGGPKNIEYLYDPRCILEVFGQDHIHHFYVGEQERQEGKLNCGKCHVIQFAIQVRK